MRSPAELTVGEATTLVDLHHADPRFLCFFHATATVLPDWVGSEIAAPYLQLIKQQLPLLDPGHNFEVAACFDDQGQGDNSCLTAVAEANCWTPAIVGAIVGHQVAEYARRDGWNMYGELNSDGTPCLANCRRYTDPTGYHPVNVPGGNNAGQKTRWQPLLEDNGRGYFTYQVSK